MTRRFLTVVAVMIAVFTTHPQAVFGHDVPAATGSYRLTLEPDDPDHQAVTVTLFCGPEGGSHTADLTAACLQLAESSGYIDRIPATALFCSAELFPVTARAQGQWGGQARLFAESYGNWCHAKAATGGNIFDFWIEGP